MIDVRFESLDYAQFDRKQVRSAMGKAARLVAREMKGTIKSGGGSGRTYRRGGRSYTASAPGQPPSRFTGNLFRSIKGRPSRRGYAMVVEAIAPHAHLLELGTKVMASRPAFAPTFANQASAIEGLLREAIGSGLTVTPGQPGQAPKEVEFG